MRKVAGTFNGTGAAVRICCGFEPDWVRVIALEDADCAQIVWSNQFRAAEMSHGLLQYTAGGLLGDPRTASDGGILPYIGGCMLDSTNQTDLTYGGGVFLGWDNKDYRQDSTYGYTDAVIDTWTLDTSANRTGHFNDDVIASVSRIGEGSRIIIKNAITNRRQTAVIESLTAGQGEAANEVTLSEAIGSGTVEYISGMYSMAPIARGKPAPAGFIVEMTSVINVNDEIQYFEAGLFD